MLIDLTKAFVFHSNYFGGCIISNFFLDRIKKISYGGLFIINMMIFLKFLEIDSENNSANNCVILNRLHSSLAHFFKFFKNVWSMQDEIFASIVSVFKHRSITNVTHYFEITSQIISNGFFMLFQNVNVNTTDENMTLFRVCIQVVFNCTVEVCFRESLCFFPCILFFSW